MTLMVKAAAGLLSRCLGAPISLRVLERQRNVVQAQNRSDLRESHRSEREEKERQRDLDPARDACCRRGRLTMMS